MRTLIDRDELLDKLPSGNLSCEDMAYFVGTLPVYGEPKGLPFMSRKKILALLDSEHEANDKLIRNALKQQEEADEMQRQIEALQARVAILELELKKDTINFKRFNDAAQRPQKAHEGDGAFDLYSTMDMLIEPFTVQKIPTGIGMEIPAGFVGTVWPRSSWFVSNKDVSGVIDSNYRGEIFVIAQNHNPQPVVVHKGDRVGQLIIIGIKEFNMLEVAELKPSNRGAKGFGSSGR